MDFALEINNQNGIAAMTFDKASTMMNNIWISLTVKRGSFFADTEFGSRLHLLQRYKNTDQTERMAVDYCKEALQWMLDSGKAKKVEAFAQRDRTQNLNRLNLLVEVTPVNGPLVSFETFIPVV